MRDALRGSWYLLVTSVVGIAWASLLLSLIAAGIGTLIVAIGAFVLIGTAELVHRVEDAEVERAARFLATEMPRSATERVAGQAPATLPTRLRDEWTPARRRQALAGVARLVTGTVLLTLTIVLWTIPLALVSTPMLAAADLEPTDWTKHVESIVDVGEWPAAAAMSVAGILLLPVAAFALRHLATAVATRTVVKAAGS